MGNPESGSRFPAEVSGMRTSGHGTPETGREKYQRTDKERITEREKEIATMKKMIKRTISILLAVMIMVTAIPVMAAETYYDIHTSETNLLIPGSYEDYNIGSVGKAKATVKSSNTKIATVKVKKGVIWVHAKKPGKVTIITKIGKKTYKTKLTILKYENPISSVKIGNTTIKGNRFNKATTIYLSYSKYQNKKQKIKLNLKKGWKLRALSYSQRNWNMDKALKNGGSVKISGGKGFYLWIYAENTKLKRTQYINIVFK